MSKIYLISPPQFELADFSQQLQEVIADPNIGAFQLRLKDVALPYIIKATKLLLPICHDHGVPFFINDHYELARDYNIDGIHIGQSDAKFLALKKEFGTDKIIGVSCQNSKHLAMVAAEQGADYVSFGAFFPTKTKKNTEKPSIDILDWWLKYTTTPCAAIGGINITNITKVVKTKVDFICMISAIWNHHISPKAAMSEIAQILQKT